MKDDYIRRWAKRYRAYQELGGKCIKCGETNMIKLDFHHLDSAKKDDGISQLTQHATWTEVKKEIDKCVLLCRNCHTEEHFIISGNKKLFEERFEQIKEKALELDDIARPKLDWDKVYNLLKLGKKLTEISHILKKDVSTIREIAYNLQILKNEKLYKTRDEINKEMQKVDKTKFIELYKQNISMIEIAKLFNCSTSTLYNLLRRMRRKDPTIPKRK